MNDFNFEDLTKLSDLFEVQNTVSTCLRLRDELFNSSQFVKIKAEIAVVNPEQKKILGKKLGIIRSNVQKTCDERIKNIQIDKEKDDFVDFDPSFYFCLVICIR
jgi:hypothetical protein